MDMNSRTLRAVAAQTAHPMAAAADRLAHEMDFARGLCEQHPRAAKGWPVLIDRATERAVRALAHADADSARAAVAQAEETLAPIARVAKRYTIHCVGHAHIDMNWMWSWPETVAVTNDTFATVLRLMDEYPNFSFSQSQASVYAILEKYNPELLEQIRRRVNEGRWEVAASHWVEGDKNMAGGEALCRHLLYTRRYMQKLFGLKPEDVPIDWSPDTFGHAATVPTYLARGGVRYCYMHRPGVSPPRSRAPSGGADRTARACWYATISDEGYNGRITPALGARMLGFARETGARLMLFVYGVGDHGGGPDAPGHPPGDGDGRLADLPERQFSTARAFFEALERERPKLPVARRRAEHRVHRLLHHPDADQEGQPLRREPPGRRRGGRRAGLGRDQFPYPADALREGWQNTLFSHFHDILPGWGVHDTRTYTHGLYQKTMAMTSMVETRALRLLASRVRTVDATGAGPSESGPGYAANALGAGVGFDALDGRLSAAEQCAGQRPAALPRLQPHRRRPPRDRRGNGLGQRAQQRRTPLKERRFAVRGPDGSLAAAQQVAAGDYWGHEYVTLAFPAAVPPLGYALRTVVETRDVAAPSGGVRQLGHQHHCAYALSERSPEGLENEAFRLTLDPVTGGIRSLLEKKSRLTLIAPGAPAPLLEYLIERPHGMTAWSIEHGAEGPKPRLVALQRKWAGPWKAAIDLKYQIAESEMTLTLEARADDPRLYIHLNGTWFQRGTDATGVPTLRLALPLALQKAQARYEIPFGALDRALNGGEEVPALQWAMVRGFIGKRAAGCLLANDSKHGHSLDGGTLRLTLIRSAYDPDPLPEIGRHEVHLALMPFTGSLATADAIRLGNDLNHPLGVVGTDTHPGDLPPEASFASVSPSNAVLCGLKKAEQENGLVVRLFESEGRRTTARVHLNSKMLGRIASVMETDLLERAVSKSSARATTDGVTVALPKHGIATVLVKLRK